MCTIKDRNGRDLTEAEDIEKRWQEYTEELYKRDPHVPDNHDHVITHLELDILECEVKWALGSITTNKATGSDRIPVELSQMIKMMLLKCCTQYARKSEVKNYAVATGLEKVSFHSHLKGNANECSNYRTIALILHASKTMLKILQPRLQQYMNHELPNVQAGLRKGRRMRDQIANIRCITEKAREFQKNICFFIVDHNKLWKILQKMGILDHLTCLLRNLHAGQETTVRTGHGT